MFEKESARKLGITVTQWSRYVRPPPDPQTPIGRFVAIEMIAVGLAAFAVVHAQLASQKSGSPSDDITLPPMAAAATLGGEGALYNAVDDTFLDSYRYEAAQRFDAMRGAEP